jgi:hypothetical protein
VFSLVTFFRRCAELIVAGRRGARSRAQTETPSCKKDEDEPALNLFHDEPSEAMASSRRTTMNDITSLGIEAADSPTFRWSAGMLAIDRDGVTDRVVEVTSLPGFGEMIRCKHITYLPSELIPDLSDPITRASMMGVEVWHTWAAGEEERTP